jgi:hypothetical protein
MRFLIASDFLRDENAGAAGAILDIGRALADRGHGIDYLWKDDKPYKLPHPSMSRWLEPSSRQRTEDEVPSPDHRHDRTCDKRGTSPTNRSRVDQSVYS